MPSEPDAPRRLAVCPDCHHDYVAPLDGVEHDEQRWWLELRCGWCGSHRALLASDDETFALCEEIELGLARISAAAERLNRERREAEIEIFAAALARDLITGEDFGPWTNRTPRRRS